MSRSVKKGPYVEAKLFSRIQAMNEANEKKVMGRSTGEGVGCPLQHS